MHLKYGNYFNPIAYVAEFCLATNHFLGILRHLFSKTVFDVKNPLRASGRYRMGFP